MNKLCLLLLLGFFSFPAVYADSIGFAVTSSQIDESEKNVVLTVQRDTGQSTFFPAISIDFATKNGTATSGEDFQTTQGKIEFPQIQSSLSASNVSVVERTISIPIINDSIDEESETFSVELSNCQILNVDSCNENLVTTRHVITIMDDDNIGNLGFSDTSYQTNEDGGNLTVSVARTNGSDGAVSVNYQTSNKSATAGSDYITTSGTLSWNNQESGIKTFVIPILTDNILEDPESFEIQLLNPSAKLKFVNNIAEAVINDSTQLGELVLESAVITAAEGDMAQITVARNNGVDGEVYVDYQTFDKSAVAGSDYITTIGSFIWADKEAGTRTIEIPILKDSEEDPNETFGVRLLNASSGLTITNSEAEVSITDLTKKGNLVLETNTISVDEGTEAQVTITRQNGIDGVLSINYQTENESALAGEDYVLTTGVLTWADQEGGSKSIKIPTNKDADSESTETFKITFNSPAGDPLFANDPVTVSIVNEIIPGTINLTRSTITVKENSILQVEVVREGGADGESSVNYATSDIEDTENRAIAGVDYTAVNGSLVWDDGDNTAKIIQIPISNDLINDVNERFKFSLSAAQGAGLGSIHAMTVTIDNLQFSLEDLSNLTPRQRQMAKVLDNACTEAFGGLLDRCKEMFQGEFTEDELKEILQQLLPTEVGSMGSTAIKLGTTQLTNLMKRLSDLRKGQRGFSADGLTFNIQGESLPVGKMLGGGASSDILSNEQFGFFIHGKINVGDKDQTDRETGFEFSTQGVTAGMDYRFNNELVMGAAFGYGHTNTRYDQSRGEMDANAIMAAFYGSYYLPQSFYIDWVLSYGFHDYEVDRNIHYNNADFAASSTPEGNQYDVAVSLGKDLNWQNWLLNSYARIEYQVVDIESYQESGGHGFALRIGEQSVNSFTTAFGGQLAYNWSQSWGVLTPAARFEWEHQYMDNSRHINASFVNSNSSGGVLSLATDDTDRNYFNLGASINATFSQGRSAFIMYETRLGQENISSHAVELGIRISF